MSLLDIFKKGSVDRSVDLRIVDSTDGTPETGVVFNTSGIDLWYRREGAAKVSVTEATLASLSAAHSDGGFLHIGDGVYRFDLPDAAFATGANYVTIGGTVTGMVVIGGRVKLVDYDSEDAVRLGLTALPNAAANATGGLPVVDSAGRVKAQFRLQKNASGGWKALFTMHDATTKALAPGKTVTVVRSLDGGSFGGGALGSVTEVANGLYYVDMAQSDINANAAVLYATASGCDPTMIVIDLEP